MAVTPTSSNPTIGISVAQTKSVSDSKSTDAATQASESGIQPGIKHDVFQRGEKNSEQQTNAETIKNAKEAGALEELEKTTPPPPAYSEKANQESGKTILLTENRSADEVIKAAEKEAFEVADPPPPYSAENDQTFQTEASEDADPPPAYSEKDEKARESQQEQKTKINAKRPTIPKLSAEDLKKLEAELLQQLEDENFFENLEKEVKVRERELSKEPPLKKMPPKRTLSENGSQRSTSQTRSKRQLAQTKKRTQKSASKKKIARQDEPTFFQKIVTTAKAMFPVRRLMTLPFVCVELAVTTLTQGVAHRLADQIYIKCFRQPSWRDINWPDTGVNIGINATHSLFSSLFQMMFNTR